MTPKTAINSRITNPFSPFWIGSSGFRKHQHQKQQQQQQRLLPKKVQKWMVQEGSAGQERESSSSLSSSSYEDLRPTTSFGAEAVPEAQRPVNEYLDVTSQPLFDWASKGTRGLLIRLIVLYNVLFWTICYPISGATYTMDGYLVQKLASSNVGAICVILALIFRLYSGWSYIGQRLTSKVIEYEETGWYDGSFEYKTETELKRDRFLYNSDVKPVVDQLRMFLISTVLLTIVSVIGLKVTMDMKPLPFDQYDPTILERLPYDDKLASKAAQSTPGGRPAYCDSRYYQAVANGGQGCN